MRIPHQGGVLALDLNSRATGVAFGSADVDAPRTITWKLPGCSDDDSLHRTEAFLRNSVFELCGLIKPAFVAIEAPFQSFSGQSNARTALALISLAAVASEAGQSAGTVVTRVHVATWRKHFTGSGRPENPKAATLAVCRLLKWAPANDDEADACGLWSFEMSKRYPKWASKFVPVFAGAGAMRA